MKTMLTALGVFAACGALRRRTEAYPRPRLFWKGRIWIGRVDNPGAAFGLPMKRKWVMAASAAGLYWAWRRRRDAPLAAGILLGGGASNLAERLRWGSVRDYVRFPKVPGPLGRYVYNLADGAVALGAAVLLAKRQRREQ